MAKKNKKEDLKKRDPFAYQLIFRTGKGGHKDKRKKGSKKQQAQRMIDDALEDEWEDDE